MKTRLGDIITTLTDYHANGSYEALKKHVDLLDEPDYALMIRTTNFEQNDFDRVNKYISKDAYDYMTKSKVYPYDIIMNKIANAGSVYLVPNLNRPISLAMNLFLIRIDKTKANPIYVFNHLKLFEPYIKQFANGTAAVTITKDAVRNLKFDFPLLAIQHKIASILSTYDDLIENNKQRIKLLEEMAEEIYKEWFVRLRFPGYETSAFFEGEGSRSSNFMQCSVPIGWEKVTINDAFEILGGGTPSTEIPEFWQEGKINWFSPTDITGSENIFLNKSGNQITALGLSNSSAKLFPAKSVMITSRATIGAIGINMTEASTNQGFITCLPNINFSYPYIYEWVKSNIKLLDSYSTGATFKEISKGVFKKLFILKPDLKIMKAFTEIVEPMFDEMNILGQKSEILQQTRDLLLPRLISGKLSVEHMVDQNPDMKAVAH